MSAVPTLDQVNAAIMAADNAHDEALRRLVDLFLVKMAVVARLAHPAARYVGLASDADRPQLHPVTVVDANGRRLNVDIDDGILHVIHSLSPATNYAWEPFTVDRSRLGLPDAARAFGVPQRFVDIDKVLDGIAVPNMSTEAT